MDYEIIESSGDLDETLEDAQLELQQPLLFDTNEEAEQQQGQEEQEVGDVEANMSDEQDFDFVDRRKTSLTVSIFYALVTIFCMRKLTSY